MYVALNKSVCQICKCKVVACNGDYTPSRRASYKTSPSSPKPLTVYLSCLWSRLCYVKHLSVDKEHKTKRLKPEDLSLIKDRGSLIKGLRPVKSAQPPLRDCSMSCFTAYLPSEIYRKYAVCEQTEQKKWCPLVSMMDCCNTARSIWEYDLSQ